MRTLQSAFLGIILVASAPRAVATDFDWVDARGGTWIPDAPTVAAMKSEFVTAFAVLAAHRKGNSLSRAHFYMTYQAVGSGSSRLIDLVGGPFPNPNPPPPSKGTTTGDACEISGTYDPLKHRFSDLRLSGLVCPPTRI